MRLPAHCLLEAYSGLTRLPSPHRMQPRLARRLLKGSFAHPPLTVDGGTHAALLDRLAEEGISGGATYDALLALTAARHDALLLTRDGRAVRIYTAFGVPFELVG